MFSIGKKCEISHIAGGDIEMTERELKQSLQGGESAMDILSAFMECIKQDASTSDKNAGKIFLPPAINEVNILH
jgi:hypothetical protein